jgi:hypothetical protein
MVTVPQATQGAGFIEVETAVSVAATVLANSTSGADCSGDVTEAGYNLDDDGSCGFSAAKGS